MKETLKQLKKRLGLQMYMFSDELKIVDSLGIVRRTYKHNEIAEILMKDYYDRLPKLKDKHE